MDGQWILDSIKSCNRNGYQVNDNILILGDSNSDLFIELDHSNTLLDPIIVSDTINYIYSNVLKEPSEISNHDAS